ncbi:putative holin [Escherichia fergusonii]|uniref:putative holin n=1 Tax=Escherichia fergusonii TaxID=564 RepID=UPI0020CD995E|nr:putative holin [Escherichia fergusonii]MCP9661532.1 phage holin family protein [Escherichia fergusonii]
MSDGLFIRCFTGTAAGAYLSGLPAEVVLGAFGGALIFIVSATEYSTLRRVVLALASFICGTAFCLPIPGPTFTFYSHVTGVFPSLSGGGVEQTMAFEMMC